MPIESICFRAQIANIILGTQADPNGIVKNSATSFKITSESIYVNVGIINGEKGETMNLTLKHIESGTPILAKAVIEDRGNSMLVSKFTPPAHGWLKGAYRLIITSSTGLNKSVDFTIE